jgi:hypothetical protein
VGLILTGNGLYEKLRKKGKVISVCIMPLISALDGKRQISQNYILWEQPKLF